MSNLLIARNSIQYTSLEKKPLYQTQKNYGRTEKTKQRVTAVMAFIHNHNHNSRQDLREDYHYNRFLFFHKNLFQVIRCECEYKCRF